ncbi:siphovirus Gp157 family protein [Streptococcus suis]|uniref:siphovirus Gp157 family protein n=1 Tax=Streptococcus suis TaxID=1307 RepID=UPI001CF3C889|nr:siphovirus Gp157 family protein [Streptococcus suis]MCB2882320.1 siphovirus Gp157 family protein [Streptococcus suis]MCB2911085.1 siphovirus Gp157 family protein [Streptococcus suis]MCB2911178.1 siphovirus Gp157 family protein [Streptococcus suis]MCB2913221.1 siphovirus Gp157 family protein [Streptococcus suis]MDW8585345.1 siphovirus Gp157 family protein [Streptococcus suis]
MTETLYGLTGQYLEVYQQDVEEGTKIDTLEAMDWKDNFVNKIEGYVKVIKNLDADEAVVDEEIKRLQNRKKSIRTKKQYLKDGVQYAMEVTGNKRVKTALFSITVANNQPSVVVDEDLLPKKYFVQKLTPDKTAIKELLKAGKKVKGAVLQESRSLRIR